MKKLIIAALVLGCFAVAAPAFAADGTISGTVTHAANATPVEGLWMSATNTSSGVVSYVYGTAADGSYSLTLTPGTYDVTTYTTTTTEPGVIFLQQTATIAVGSGETQTHNFGITRRGKFSGTITAAGSGTAISGAWMYFTHVSGITAGYGYGASLSTGGFTITPTPNDATVSAAGTYTVTVTRAGYFGASVTGVVLTGDETTVTQNISLTPGSTISGVVVDSNGAALSGATVVATKSIYGSTYAATTDASGAFTISVYDLSSYNGTAVGDYTLTASKTGYVSKTSSASITADASALTGNNFSLVSAGKITGTTKTGNATLSGVLVYADDGFGHIYSTTSDSNGAYTLSSLFPSSSYTLTATKTNYVGQKVYNINVGAGATVSGKNITLPAAKVFSGTVKAKSNSAALEGATVTLYKRNHMRTEIADFSFTTKSNGSFLFQNVSPGKYRLKIVKAGYVTSVQDSITISANVTGKTYKLDLGSSLTGRVTAGGKAVASADISVYALNNGKYVSLGSLSSDENGYYLFTSLKKGTYRMKITTQDYITQVFNVAVSTGKKKTVNVKLAAGGSVSGYVTDKETGLPVSVLIKVVGSSATTWSDTNGFFVLDGLTPGSRRIYAVSAYYNSSGQKTVSVSAGKTASGVNFSLTPKQ